MKWRIIRGVIEMKCKTIDYDKEHDILFIHIGGKVKTDYSVEIGDDVVVDMKRRRSKQDIPIGIEIMNVKKYLK